MSPEYELASPRELDVGNRRTMNVSIAGVLGAPVVVLSEAEVIRLFEGFGDDLWNVA